MASSIDLINVAPEVSCSSPEPPSFAFQLIKSGREPSFGYESAHEKKLAQSSLANSPVCHLQLLNLGYLECDDGFLLKNASLEPEPELCERR